MTQKRIYAISSVLIYAGSCMLIAVVTVYVYGHFEIWIQAQPRALTSTRVLWPEVPPLTPLPSPTPMPTSTPTATPTPTPTPGPPVHIEVPALAVDRAVVPVGTVMRGSRLEWDAESLFATVSRRDLVGHLEGSTNPGQPGNVVLIGHNYNRGFNWAGVFYALHILRQGDVVHLLNEENSRFTYQVQEVNRVPWRAYSDVDVMTHIAYLSPTKDETLTLVTCGGANIAPFPNRIYVVAKRAP